MFVKHAVKTGLAAALAWLLFQKVLPDAWVLDTASPIWAVLSAIIVMQTNLGRSFKDSADRVLGTGIGAFTGSLLALFLPPHFLGLAVGVSLTIVACSLLGLQASFRLAGATTALVLLSHQDKSPWVIGLHRFLDIGGGVAVALLTQVAVWPSRAGTALRQELANHLPNQARLCQVLLEACLQGSYRKETVDDLRGKVLKSQEKIQDLLQDLQSEWLGSHYENTSSLAALAGQVEAIQEHLLAMDYPVQKMATDTFHRHLEGELWELARAMQAAFDWLSRAVVGPEPCPAEVGLGEAIAAAERALVRVREAKVARVHDTEEILRFCSFFFDARSAALGLKRLGGLVGFSPDRHFLAGGRPEQE